MDETIEKFLPFLEDGDILIDGGNEWFENSRRRAAMLEPKGIKYLAVGVSGGEARQQDVCGCHREQRLL